MQTFRAYAVMFTASEIRRRDTLNIASNDPSVNWQFSFSDQNSADDVVDPLTNRVVDRVSWSQYTMADDAPPGTAYDEEIGHNATMSYNSTFPYDNLVIDVPTKVRIEQDGSAVRYAIDGTPTGYWIMYFNVTKL